MRQSNCNWTSAHSRQDSLPLQAQARKHPSPLMQPKQKKIWSFWAQRLLSPGTAYCYDPADTALTSLYSILHPPPPFSPAFWVQQLSALPCFTHIPGVPNKLIEQLPSHLVACRGTNIDHADVKEFTKQALECWASNYTKFQTWALAARVALCLSLSPNSASSERVFTLLQCLFGADRRIKVSGLERRNFMYVAMSSLLMSFLSSASCAS